MKVLVELDVCDAMQIGSSMQMLAKAGRVPERATSEGYLRVGAQLTKAASAVASQIGRDA